MPRSSGMHAAVVAAFVLLLMAIPTVLPIPDTAGAVSIGADRLTLSQSAPPAMPPRQTTDAAVMVDNAAPGFSIVAGEWGTCENGDCQGTCFGQDFRYAEPGCGECRAQFTLEAPANGEYDLWTWWPRGDDRATDTPFTVQHSGGSLSLVIDQRNSGNDWWWLVTLYLEAGEPVTVTVEGAASGYANADAIALTPAGSGAPGAASTGSTPTAAGQLAKVPAVQYFYAEATPREGCHYLHWDVSQATGVYLDGVPVENPGSTEVCPVETTNYALSAENEYGSAGAVVTIAVGSTEAIVEPLPSAAPVEIGPAPVPAGGAIIVDHTCTDLSRIPDEWIDRARALTLHYAHTSHGEQILHGILRLEEIDPHYDVAVRNWDPAGLPDEAGALRIYDGNNYDGDNYIMPEMYWNDPDGQEHTRSVARTGLFSLSMWSWCGQQSENSPDDVQRYLETLNQIEAEFPGMRFIYMTGHSDGTTGGTLARNNQVVRDYVRAHGKVLFDFEDIETHDPAGNYYPNDAEAQCLWCDDWCAVHPEDCTNLPYQCPHSEATEAQKLNCKLKANAFWWLMARLAGWDGVAQ